MLESLLAAAVAFTMTVSTPEEINLVFAGDAMMHTGQIEAARQPSGEFDYSDCFTYIAPYVKAADYAIVNLETPVGYGDYSGFPQFNAPVSWPVALADAGFDLFLTANNHTLDRRDAGLKRTVHILDSLGLDHIGTYTNADERTRRIPFVKNIRGFRVGFLNYTYGTNGISVSGDAKVDYINADQIRSDIAATRRAGAEILVVAMHWGEEYTLQPVEYERRWARVLEDEGVDIIMGGHPHVVQPMELRTGRKSGKPMFLAYSHGNFISNMMTRDTRGGLMTRVTIGRDSAGVATVKDAAYRLIYTTAPTDGTFAPKLGAGKGASQSPAVRYGFKRPNYQVIHADSVEGFWQGRAREFASAARNAFRNNVGNITAE